MDLGRVDVRRARLLELTVFSQRVRREGMLSCYGRVVNSYLVLTKDILRLSQRFIASNEITNS